MKHTSPTREEWLNKIQIQRKTTDPHSLLSRTTLDNRTISAFETQSKGHHMAYTPSPWVRCQRYHTSDAQQLNAIVKADLQNGMNGIWIGLDSGVKSTLRGNGAALWNLERWDQLLDGVFLEAVPLHIDGPSVAPRAAAAAIPAPRLRR